MNFSRLQQTRIADLAPVYGGARGRTMSSRHQLYAWRALQEAGIKTMIDLRLSDHTDRLPALCEQYGLRYFHYPMDTSDEAVGQMASLYPLLCEHIDAGDFYIACAMGLHRTDIVLCAYWIFHGAERGLDAPVLYGYRQEKNVKIDKLLRLLNSLYERLCNAEEKPIISLETFKKRKALLQTAYTDNNNIPT